MRKYKAGAAIALSLVMGVSMLSGCSTGTSSSSSKTTTESASSSKSSSTDNEENKVYGVVKSVSSDSVTIEVGTLNEQSKPDNKQSGDSNSTDNSSEKNGTDSGSGSSESNKDSSSTNGSNDSSKNSDTNSTASTEQSSSEAPAEKSMITTTGETKTITLTSSTKVSQEMPGNPPQSGAPGNGQQPPQQNGSDNNSTSNNGTSNNSAEGSDANSNSSDSGTTAGGNNSSQNGSQKQSPVKPEENNQNGTDNNSTNNNSSDSNSSTEKTTDNTADSSTAKQSDNSSEAKSNSNEKDANSSSDNSSSDNKNESQSKELSVSDLKENDEVCITLDSDGNASEISLLSGGGPGGENGSAPQGGGQSVAPTSYTAATEYSEDKTTTGKTYSSTGTDENAVHVTDGAKVTLKDATVSRESEDSQGGDSSSFYGTGAAVLTTDGTSYISGSKITTNANGGAGIFSYGNGTTYVSDTTISTKKDTSGGLHVAGGGKLYAWDVTATTQGESSAAIRSDRGGGTMVVDGGTYTSNGTGSPAVYSTADIAVHNADLTANNSESVCIEGLNSLRLFDCNLTGNMKDDSQNDCTWNVILYQSMSGDSEVGNSTFEMDGGTLTAKNGGMFYTTNTESTIRLSNVDITYAKDNDFFLKCTGNSNQRGWGTSGSNGADCNFTADNQKMEGDVIWDSISQLDFYMSNGSTLKGAVTDDESNAGNGGSGYCNFYIAKGCTWTVTGDSTLTNLYNAGTVVDNDGKTVTIKGTDGTVYVKGDSEYTITVSSYSTKADMSGMTEATEWKDYETEKQA